MRRLFLLISIVMQATLMTTAATFPEVSTEGNEHWYYIQMQRGMTVLTSMGEGKNMQTAEAVAAKKDVQLWKVEAVDSKHYRLTTRGGQVMFYSPSAGKFQTAAAAVGTATHAVKVTQPEEFNTAVLAIIEAVKKKQYATVKQYFTDEGFGMFDALVHYGDARILGTPALNFYELQGRTICRSIPMSFTFKNNKRKFTEDVTLTFNSEKKIESVAFGLSKNARDAVFEKQAPWSDDVRMSIVTFLENYKTAFALKRLDYIRSIFDDNAIIIVGHVTKAAPKSGENARYSNSDIVKYNRLDKNTYLDNLEKCFKSNEFINIRFSDNEISRMGVGGDTYGIQIHQDYYSSSYGDTGYLFVLVDLNDVFQPCIKVRTWQPERDPNLNANGGWDNPHYGLYWGGNF